MPDDLNDAGFGQHHGDVAHVPHIAQHLVYYMCRIGAGGWDSALHVVYVLLPKVPDVLHMQSLMGLYAEV